MQNWNIDPNKKDYVLERGSPQQTDSLTIPAYIRLKTRRGSYMYAPDDRFGSEFHLQKKRRTSVDNSSVEDLAAAAVQPIVDDGRASEILIEAEVKNRNNVSFTTKIIDQEGSVDTLEIKSLGV
jgi:phage gp46-like protein